MTLMNTVSKQQALAILAQQGNRFLTVLRGTVFVSTDDGWHSVSVKTDLYDAQVAIGNGTKHVLMHWSQNETIDHDEIQCTIGTSTFTFRVKPVTEIPAEVTE